MVKRGRTDNAGSADAAGDSEKNNSHTLETEHVAFQAEYVKDSALASQGLMELVMHEARNIDITTVDFAESELDFDGITKVMKYSGPEEEGRSIKASMMLHTAEGVITMSKVAEIFLMDLALKAWQARDIETSTTSLRADDAAPAIMRSSLNKHEINAPHLQRAIRTHEEFDFLAETAYSYGLRDSFLQKEVSDAFEKPVVKSATNPASSARRGSLQVLPVPVAPAPAASPRASQTPPLKPAGKGVIIKASKNQEPAGWRGLQITSTGGYTKASKKTPPKGSSLSAGNN